MTLSALGQKTPHGMMMEAELALVGNDRVSGVVAAGESGYDVRVLGEHIYYLALAFVAPLGAKYRVCRHPLTSGV